MIFISSSIAARQNGNGDDDDNNQLMTIINGRMHDARHDIFFSASHDKSILIFKTEFSVHGKCNQTIQQFSGNFFVLNRTKMNELKQENKNNDAPKVKSVFKPMTAMKIFFFSVANLQIKRPERSKRKVKHWILYVKMICENRIFNICSKCTEKALCHRPATRSILLLLPSISLCDASEILFDTSERWKWRRKELKILHNAILFRRNKTNSIALLNRGKTKPFFASFFFAGHREKAKMNESRVEWLKSKKSLFFSTQNRGNRYEVVSFAIQRNDRIEMFMLISITHSFRFPLNTS